MKTCEELADADCCRSHDQRKKVVAEEKRSKYIMQNPKQKTLLHLTVDACLLDQADGEQCDRLIAVCEDSKLFFVELKGSSVKKAASQLLSTVEHAFFQPYLKDAKASFARIVPTRVQPPDLRSSAYRKLEERMARLKGNVRQQAQQMTEAV